MLRPTAAALAINLGTVLAQNVFSGVWRPGSTAQTTYSSSNYTEFAQKWTDYEKNGYLLDDYEVYTNEGKPVYFGLFSAGTGAHAAWITPDWKGFTQKWDEFAKAGLRMHDFEAYTIDNTLWYAGIFHEGAGAHASWVTSNWTDLMTKWRVWEQGNLRIHDFETYLDKGTRMYAGIFREGTGGTGSYFTNNWQDFLRQWDVFDKQGLQLWDFEFWKDGSTWTYGGVFRPGGGRGRYGWFGVDWENFRAFAHERTKEAFVLQDVEVFPTSCSATCLNTAVMPTGWYDYGITGSSTHCEGPPGTCAGNTASVFYRGPFYEEADGSRFLRLSAVQDIAPIFTLPFAAPGLTHNGWLYAPGSWHHAIDYGAAGGATFDVRAAADGVVVHVGWDWWSGTTVVVSHDDPGAGAAGVDRYRTVHMHLRDGAQRDCARSWAVTAPQLDVPASRAAHDNYVAFLAATGCARDGSGVPDPAYWGAAADRVRVAVGQRVARGQVLAAAGCTGPGGCGCTTGRPARPNTHLHIFFARRDATDARWYFFDPYGIYGPTQCYPTAGNAGGGNAATQCARYPSAWLGGTPRLPSVVSLEGEL